jgi:regulator of ribonuclease activity A
MLLAKKRLSKRENAFFIGRCCFFHWRIGTQDQKEFQRMAQTYATSDLCDLHKGDDSGNFRVLPPVFLPFGGRKSYFGIVETVRCHEDNSLVKAALESPGWVEGANGRTGKVLVVAGGGSLRRALVGGNIAAAASRNLWAGIVIDGCVRDVLELAQLPVGISALASMPMPTEKRNEGQSGVAVQIHGVWVRPGDWLYADEDGIVVGSKPLA